MQIVFLQNVLKQCIENTKFVICIKFIKVLRNETFIYIFFKLIFILNCIRKFLNMNIEKDNISQPDLNQSILSILKYIVLPLKSVQQ